MAANATIEYGGKKIKYDAAAVKSWKMQRKLAAGGAGMFEALDVILLGKADEIAEVLGDSVEEMTSLLTAIAEKEADAKN